MVPRAGIASWLKPSISAKRNRDIEDNGEAQDFDEVNDPPIRPKKAARTTSSTNTKSKNTVASANKDAKKIYTDTLKALDKGIDKLDKKVKVMSGNSTAITSSSYASSVHKHMAAVNTLLATDSTLAFKLLLSMADASHTDLDATCKMCGTPDDNSIPTFKLLDEALLPLIQKREKPTCRKAGLPEVPMRWTLKDADVGVFKTGRPNKQQWSQMYRQKLAWEKNRRQARRERREKTEDWVKVALNDLVDERYYLSAYGVKGYLPKSIEELVKEARTV